MKRFLSAGLPLLLAGAVVVSSRPCAAGSPGEVAGAWTAIEKDDDRGMFQFMMNLDHDGNVGRGYARTDFTGLAAIDVDSKTAVPVTFALRREPGTVRFEGHFRNGRGAGDFTFEPNLAFARRLRDVGVAFDAERGEEASLLFQLATNDLTIDFIRSMQAIGYKESLQQYVEFRIFKVDPACVRAMEEVGFRNLSAQKLVETKIHNVTPDYVRSMRARGENLSLDGYVQARIFQVTPEFAEEMRKLGYPNLDHETLVAFRIHNVTADFVQDLRKLAYDKVAAEDLIAMRIHNVTPDYIRRANAAAHRKVPVEKLIEMRIFDVDAEDAI